MGRLAIGRQAEGQRATWKASTCATSGGRSLERKSSTRLQAAKNGPSSTVQGMPTQPSVTPAAKTISENPDAEARRDRDIAPLRSWADMRAEQSRHPIPEP